MLQHNNANGIKLCFVSDSLGKKKKKTKTFVFIGRYGQVNCRDPLFRIL